MSGQWYRTRDGRRVFVAFAENGRRNGLRPKETYWTATTWALDGRWGSDGEDHPLDLIAPCDEPTAEMGSEQ